MTKEQLELKNRLDNHEKLRIIRNIVGGDYGVKLVGGAVVDIMEGREPKDYDILGWDNDTIAKFRDKGFDFYSDTKTAKTYIKDDIVVQFLKTKIDNFDYTISQTTFNFRTGNVSIDAVSFEKKILVPVNYKGNKAKNTLMRLPHWRRKGYDIPDVTYFSLLNAISSNKITVHTALPS